MCFHNSLFARALVNHTTFLLCYRGGNHSLQQKAGIVQIHDCGDTFSRGGEMGDSETRRILLQIFSLLFPDRLFSLGKEGRVKSDVDAKLRRLRVQTSFGYRGNVWKFEKLT